MFTSESLLFRGNVSKFHIFVDMIAKISAYCKYIVSYCCGGNFSISLVHGDEDNA